MSSDSYSMLSSDCYDFTKTENAARWKGLFTPSLRKVLEQVHPRLTAKEDALSYVETLCLRILAMLCAKPLPHSVQDVEDKVKKSFPAPIDRWALKAAKDTIILKKRKLVLPTDRVHSLLQKDVLQYKIDNSVTIFLVAVLEYISADILEWAGNYVIKIKHCEITNEDIKVAICADKVLMDMFYQSDIKTNVVPSPLPTLPSQRTSTTYEEVVKELIHDEKQYQRELHMIIRVFREELMKIVYDPKELEPIFSNIIDIYELTVTLLGSLEDVIEMSQEQSAPYVGNCFEELAEAFEFDIYTKYAREVTSKHTKDALNILLAKPDAMSLELGQGFRDACKYYLPKLLLVPLWHAFVYFDYIKLLKELSLPQSQEDVESLSNVQGLLCSLRVDLEKTVADLPKESCVPFGSRARRQLAIERTRELQNSVEHWDKDVGQNCNEFIREDSLIKVGSSKRSDRKVYLFDGLMLLCKANNKRQVTSAGVPTFDYRLKEKFFMRRVEINDRADTDDLKNSFEIVPRTQPAVILTAKNPQHKNDWMADLMMVNTRSMLDRFLDSILLDIEKKHPLRMPSPEIYKFSIPDSLDNIVLEERESTGVPLIKGATLCKLIERLTYHIYADPMFVRTFLTTYRYFCSPQNLLTLLIERFNIPDPSLVYQDAQQSAEKDDDKIHKNSQREDWKRYRKEYVQPVQFRVLNVLRHWVDHHFYDFEKDQTLLDKLQHFLDNVNGKSMRKWVDSVLKIVQRKKEQEKSPKQIIFAYGLSPPPIEHHLNVPDAEINLLTLHPLELARQLTLLEFELYKNVKPSELVGSPWTKKDKELNSPNLLKIMKHTTNVTRWIEKSIIDAENFEERVAMVTRAIEVMMVMLELNNFNGILSISAAMASASVFRLKLTFRDLQARDHKFLEECRELNDGHLKKYQERLRSINPPCVPFFGRYLTNILHLEEGNSDFLQNTELINFSKRRRVSEIIGEIQQYQNQPYCLLVDPKIRSFLETLDPFKGMSDTDLQDFLYHESLRIEPKGCKQAPKFPRKWPSIALKSPGIKPRRQNNNNNSSGNISNVQLNNALAQSSNPQSYSVFANVNIGERNGSAWVQSHQPQVVSNTAAFSQHKTSICEADSGEVPPHPLLPKKQIGISTNAYTRNVHEAVEKPNFSPSSAETMAPIDEAYLQHHHHTHTMVTASNNSIPVGVNEEKLVGSPRQEMHSAGNRSPFQSPSAAIFSKLNSSPASHLSPTDITIIPAAGSPQMSEMDFINPLVPVSPHVNVPTAALNVEYRTAPPPLPPRRKERTESCADIAQKRQAPDAPTLPPRDGELSPPPVPPRNHSIGTYPRTQTNEFIGSNSLSLPNTSSIMIRRNSAIEKRSAVAPATAVKTVNTFNAMPRLQTLALGEPAISPAHSSSTTTSPLSPTTPNSPLHIPTGHQTDACYNMQMRNNHATVSVSALHAQQQHLPYPGSSGLHMRSSSNDFSPLADSTPKLPPKPSLGGNIYNNADKGTMFRYPSTNQ